MNKSVLLSAGLFSLIAGPVLAETTDAATPAPTGAINQTLPAATPPAATTPTPTGAINQTPSNSTQAPEPTAATTPPASTSPTTTAPVSATPVITPPVNATALDCNYHIPADTSKVDTSLVMQWAQKAAQQTFAFTPTTLDNQLSELKACYTEQGWLSYYDALQKSGNLDAIKQQKLNVSSLTDGQSSITQIKDNQWKVVTPIQVIYQNDKEKIIQSLTINLIVSRKVSGDLGIIQIVAMPRQAINNTPATPAAGNNSNTNTTTTPNPTSSSGSSAVSH